jgi:hypothetical protein
MINTHPLGATLERERGVSLGPTAPKRLSLVLADAAYDELDRLACQRQTSMKEVVRLGIGLVKIAVQEAKNGNKLVVATTKGEVLKELVLPE